MKSFTAIFATLFIVLFSPILSACSMVQESTPAPTQTISAPATNDGVTVNPGNGHGGAITADYMEMHYIVWEDCSVSFEHDGKQVGGLDDYRDMGTDSPVRAPLVDTANDVMPWCGDE